MRHPRSSRTVSGVLAAALLAAVLAGCGGGSRPAESEAGAPAPARVQENQARDAGGAGGTGGAGGGNAQTGRQVVIDDRAVVHTAGLRVRAPKVDAAAAQAKQLVAAAGGYVQQESSGGGGAQLTFKIPSERYTPTLDGLARLGTRLSLNQRAEDVTEEVADVDSRVRSAEASLESFRRLLRRADTVGEVIEVEREIASRQADLEALQARQKSLAHRTRYATVTLTLVGPERRPDRDDGQGGFLGGLERGWNGLLAVGGALAVVAGFLLPLTPVFVLIGAVAWIARGVRRGRRRPPGD
ncbi:DUF4349 domain-containing protein [Thermomonospora amylolytica]|uniref:DUF4349 domain-containing protein n=1 Tax=Thermomonospora amylolytica TaxID=1411117 RepID=UPI000E6CCAD6|nr:DUF4349 domain-containing protein [Thermomonospora amylolytica]